MAEKGVRAELEQLVRQSYIDTGNLSFAADQHGVSRQSAHDWKRRAGDEWDKARERKASFGLRMESLLDRELGYAEGREAGAVEGGTLDNLSKLGALVVKFKTLEATGGPSYDKAAVFLENLKWMIGYLKENDQVALEALADNFEQMTATYKEQCLSA
uniref:Uncharacterized protein n=1 Tax=Geobacter sp. (strain M21) TaxID=443144 RepID=C6E6R6_GEOSM